MKQESFVTPVVQVNSKDLISNLKNLLSEDELKLVLKAL